MSIPVISDIIKANVERAATALNREIYFDYGRELDVAKNVLDKAGAIDPAKKRKWPLVWMVSDFEEVRDDYSIYGTINNMSIIIATSTRDGLSVQQHQEQSFIPTLYPIYEELLRQFSLDIKLRKRPFNTHSKIDYYYWDAGRNGNILNQFLDVLQIKNLKLQIALPC